MIVSLWKRTTASVIIGWNTPHAPGQGSVRSSYFKPNRVIPSRYASSQSLREAKSLFTSSARSLASDCSTLSSISSARLAWKSSSPSGLMLSSKSPIFISTSSGSTISISRGSIPAWSASSSRPWGAWYSALSTAMLCPYSVICGLPTCP